jgi:Fur family ferric uptake transcriptional regulator
LIIKENRPLTIEQLLHLANGELAQSTVYRVVNDLTACGLIVGFTTPENTLVVELKKSDSDHHHHIFCENCVRIIDIELDDKLEAALEKEVGKIEKQYSLSIRGHSLELLGLCGPCSVSGNE